MRAGIEASANIAAASELVRAAASDGASFIATPEMTHLLQRDQEGLRRDVRTMSEDAGVKAFSELAAELSVHLLIGSLAILRGDGKIANRSMLFAPDGSLAAQYDKICLLYTSDAADE